MPTGIITSVIQKDNIEGVGFYVHRNVTGCVIGIEKISVKNSGIKNANKLRHNIYDYTGFCYDTWSGRGRREEFYTLLDKTRYRKGNRVLYNRYGRLQRKDRNRCNMQRKCRSIRAKWNKWKWRKGNWFGRKIPSSGSGLFLKRSFNASGFGNYQMERKKNEIDHLLINYRRIGQNTRVPL